MYMSILACNQLCSYKLKYKLNLCKEKSHLRPFKSFLVVKKGTKYIIDVRDIITFISHKLFADNNFDFFYKINYIRENN